MKSWPLKVLGISQRDTNLASREHYSKNEAEVTQLLLQLRSLYGVNEAMILSTCHRVEVYYVAQQRKTKEIRALLFLDHSDPSPQVYEISNTKDSIAHLSSVAIGMDAQIMGEAHVFHQTKAAYQLAANLDMAGAGLHRLMHSIFYAHKAILKSTSWYEGASSVPQAAIQLLRRLLEGRKKRCRALLIGAGKMGSEIAGHIRHVEQIEEVYITNRSAPKARTLAKKYGHQLLSFNELAVYLGHVDVVITCLSVKRPVIEPHQVGRGVQYLIDLSVPRSISEEVGQMSGKLLYNVDEIEETTSRTLAVRSDARGDVQDILKEMQEEFLNWCEEMTFSPTIQRFKEALEQLRRAEMERYLKEMNAEAIQEVDQVTRNLIQRIIKYPVLQIKAACKRGEATEMAEQLLQLFDISSKDKELE